MMFQKYITFIGLISFLLVFGSIEYEKRAKLSEQSDVINQFYDTLYDYQYQANDHICTSENEEQCTKRLNDLSSVTSKNNMLNAAMINLNVIEPAISHQVSLSYDSHSIFDLDDSYGNNNGQVFQSIPVEIRLEVENNLGEQRYIEIISSVSLVKEDETYKVYDMGFSHEELQQKLNE